MSGLIDSCGRRINYLRVSVTGRCNLRCIYCMPEGGIQHGPRWSILTYEEILTVVRACAQLGITSVRLTGGEPLVRKDITRLVQGIASIPGITDLSMTTNGMLLAQYARELAEAGLRRVNISLDSLWPERFAQITRCGRLNDVLLGVDAALDAGLRPVKLNVVVMRGVNDDEIVDLAQLALYKDVVVRFIELMPIGPHFRECMPSDDARPMCSYPAGLVPCREVMARLRSLGKFRPAHLDVGAGPGVYQEVSDGRGVVGFISQVTAHACGMCNRLRLTSHGRIRPCLSGDREVDVLSALRGGAGVDEIKRLVIQAVAMKPERIELGEGALGDQHQMSQIGG
ncbi:MAG: GTP 3',8-cyclase MoaA [Armatimonadota bacterium]